MIPRYLLVMIFVLVWLFNIVDLIAGPIFFPNNFEIIFWNIVGVLALMGFMIDFHFRYSIKRLKKLGVEFKNG
jgi:hypothetical protein